VLPGEWEGFGGPLGIDGPVTVLAARGGDIVIGGDFTRIDWTDFRHIATRESDRYHRLGAGLPGSVYAVLETEEGLVAGGWWLGDPPITYSSFIAVWDGVSWNEMGDGLNNRVNTLIEHGGSPYAGGIFTYSGSLAVGRVARWNGSEWERVGATGFNDDVNAFAVYGEMLVAGGEFTAVDGAPAPGLAVWDGESWSAFAGGGIEPGTWVKTLLVQGGSLFAGGSFTTIGGENVPYLARWDGSSWSSLGRGVNGSVRALALHDGALVAGGTFTEAGGAPAGRIARWDGAAWDALGGGANAEVSALAADEAYLYVGGWFTTMGGDSLDYLARWDGALWVQPPVPEVPGPMNGDIRAFLEMPDGFIAGGNFTQAGDVPARYVARLVNGEWEPMGTTLNGGMWDLAMYGDSIFCAGNTMGVRVWNETTGAWTLLGGGLNETAACLARHDGHLVAGGNFTRTGAGDTVCYAARLVDGQFEQMGGLVQGTVRALIEWEGDLIAGGDFTVDTVADVQLNHVARWDGSAWQPMGAGMDDQVHSFLVYEGELLAGGYFDNAGGAPASKVARWNGAEWEAFTPTTTIGSDGVIDLEAYNGELYAGGRFTRASGQDVNDIVRWNGETWQALDGGMYFGGGYHSFVYEIEPLNHGGGPCLLAGGHFIRAGPVWSDRIAAWRTTDATGVETAGGTESPALFLLGPNRPNPFNPATRFDYVVPDRASVTLTIHDLAGRLVATLVSGRSDPGGYTARWDGRSTAGEPAASGVYFALLRAGDRTEVRKIMLVR
jgi:hypothetical protein